MHFRRIGFAGVVMMWLMLRPAPFLAQEPGTLGFSVVELYNDEQPNKRGVLMVRIVDKGSSAEEAGIGISGGRHCVGERNGDRRPQRR